MTVCNTVVFLILTVSIVNKSNRVIVLCRCLSQMYVFFCLHLSSGLKTANYLRHFFEGSSIAEIWDSFKIVSLPF